MKQLEGKKKLGIKYQQSKKKMKMIQGGVFGKWGKWWGSEFKPDTTGIKW